MWPHAVIRVLCGDLTRLDFVLLSSVQCNSLRIYFGEKLCISSCFPWFFSIFICCCSACGGLVEMHSAMQPYADLLQPSLFCRIAECKGTLDFKLLCELL